MSLTSQSQSYQGDIDSSFLFFSDLVTFRSMGTISQQKPATNLNDLFQPYHMKICPGCTKKSRKRIYDIPLHKKVLHIFKKALNFHKKKVVSAYKTLLSLSYNQYYIITNIKLYDKLNNVLYAPPDGVGKKALKLHKKKGRNCI